MNSCQPIEEFQTPEEYLSWFESLLPPRTQDAALKKDILLHAHDKFLTNSQITYKQFYEEVFPLKSLLKFKQKEWSDQRFRNVFGRQSFDVEILNGSLKHLEITCTNFDDGEKLRMQELLKNGSVSAIARVVREEKIDRKGNGFSVAINLETQNDMRLHSEIVAEHIAVIADRIEKKSAKTYPEKTGLLVYFNDYLVGYEQDDIRLFEDLLNRTRPLWAKNFEMIFLIGPRADSCIELRR